jgi:hypothetical protein
VSSQTKGNKIDVWWKTTNRRRRMAGWNEKWLTGERLGPVRCMLTSEA